MEEDAENKTIISSENFFLSKKIYIKERKNESPHQNLMEVEKGSSVITIFSDDFHDKFTCFMDL